MPTPSPMPPLMPPLMPWASEVLKFWFEETRPEQWFKKDAVFDAAVRSRFLDLHAELALRSQQELLGDERSALAAVIVFDQMSRNMFRDTAAAFASDALALSLAQEAITRGFDREFSKAERMFFYLPFEHAEDRRAQARCVELMASLDDPELTGWATAHREIIDRFGRFPHRNAVLGRAPTQEELEFLDQPGSSF
jgi:uncharacterized protein (DUF924 family)